VILVFEAIGATTSFLYGLNHLFYTINDDVPKEVSLLVLTRCWLILWSASPAWG